MVWKTIHIRTPYIFLAAHLRNSNLQIWNGEGCGRAVRSKGERLFSNPETKNFLWGSTCGAKEAEVGDPLRLYDLPDWALCLSITTEYLCGEVVVSIWSAFLRNDLPVSVGKGDDAPTECMANSPHVEGCREFQYSINTYFLEMKEGLRHWTQKWKCLDKLTRWSLQWRWKRQSPIYPLQHVRMLSNPERQLSRSWHGRQLCLIRGQFAQWWRIGTCWLCRQRNRTKYGEKLWSAGFGLQIRSRSRWEKQNSILKSGVTYHQDHNPSIYRHFCPYGERIHKRYHV